MANLTDKMKDFNAIFKNDELAKEISQLIEKANSTKKPKNEIRYSRDELIEIGQNPLCKVSKSAINTRLAKSNLSDNIINSLLRKNSLEKRQSISDSQENINSDFFDDNAQSYNNRFKNNNVRNVKNRENLDGYRENVANSRYDREKSYRPTNSESAQSWRTDKNGGQSNNNNNRNNPVKREYVDSRYTQPRKYDRYNQRNNYGNRNGYRDDYEEEPEWFSNGPESMNEFIDLKGFDDDEKCDHNKQERSIKPNAEDSGCNSSETFDASKNESFNRNLSDMSSLLNMDVTNLFNSPNVSFLENKDINDFPLPFSFNDSNAGNSSSRAEKWFKNKKEPASTDDSLRNVSKTLSPLTVGGDKHGSIMDLFQNVNMQQFPPPPSSMTGIKVDMSKATNLADLEASLFNSNRAKKSDHHGSHNGPSSDAAVMSKLLSLAGHQEPKSTISNGLGNMPIMNHHFMNEALAGGKQMNEPAPNGSNGNGPNFHDLNQLAGTQNMNRMPPPNFFKGNGPMPPFPYGDGNMPFPMENMHPRPGPMFGQPMPPEMAPQFAGSNSFLPGFLPNAPLPSPMAIMSHMGHLPPHIAAQLMTQYAMLHQQQQQQQQLPNHMHHDIAKARSDESNLADNLKNSQFTPTVVIRNKFKDQKGKASALKPEMPANADFNLLNAPMKENTLFEMSNHQRHIPVGDISGIRASNTIPHPLSNYHQPSNDKSSIDQMFQSMNLQPLHQRPQPSCSARDIFHAMTNGEHSAANMLPLPLKNALKLEDLEKI